MIEIVLPSSPDGFYRFGDLPKMIAEARQDEPAEDRLLWVWIWRDDDSSDGTFLRCTPPDDIGCPSLQELQQHPRSAEWTIEPVPLPEAREERDRSLPLHYKTRALNQPEAERAYWVDGSLIVVSEYTQGELGYAVRLAADRDWHAERLIEFAKCPEGHPERLLVLDPLGNELMFREGQALNAGRVHLDELNRWGAMLRPPRRFVTDEADESQLGDSSEVGGAAEIHAQPASDTWKRRYRRARRFEELGGKMRRVGDTYQTDRVNGAGGALANLQREELAAGGVASDNKAVRDDLIAWYRRQDEEARKGN